MCHAAVIASRVKSRQFAGFSIRLCVSFTTIIAAEITGRSCHAIDLMPQYVGGGAGLRRRSPA